MDTDQRTVQANGITLAYRVWGPQDAPAVLLLHARGADGADWSEIAPVLAAGPRRVYALDLRGHGRSDRPGDYAYETMRDDVHAFLAALADTLPDARRLTIDAGHLVHEVRPEEFLAAVEEFLSSADRTPS
ncbi:alpha/beta fold hydrolase [Streptomyces violaceus]|uniref:Alpha/beta fold hydrolase n=1 Tax=Streptomyces violaceus TaxID=1936 RepID=A0ABZ1NKM7_STRVL